MRAVLTVLFGSFFLVLCMKAEAGETDLLWPPQSPAPILTFLGTLEFSSPGHIHPNIQRVAVAPDEANDIEGGWFYEDYLLLVTNHDGDVIAHPFYAAYGNFLVSVPFRLFGKIDKYIVLVRQTGKGTGIHTTLLEIFTVNKRSMKRIYQRKVADSISIWGDKWFYRIRLAAIPGTASFPTDLDRGLELKLVVDPVGRDLHEPWDGKDVDGKALPKIICIAGKKGAITEVEGQSCDTAFSQAVP